MIKNVSYYIVYIILKKEKIISLIISEMFFVGKICNV